MLVPDCSFLPELWDTHSQKPFAGASGEEVLTFQKNLSVSHLETNLKQKRTIIISITLQNYYMLWVSIRFWFPEYNYFCLNFLTLIFLYFLIEQFLSMYRSLTSQNNWNIRQSLNTSTKFGRLLYSVKIEVPEVLRRAAMQ